MERSHHDAMMCHGENGGYGENGEEVKSSRLLKGHEEGDRSEHEEHEGMGSKRSMGSMGSKGSTSSRLLKGMGSRLLS